MKLQIILAILAFAIVTILLPPGVQAQDCPQLVQDAYDLTQEACDAIGSDEVCYGNLVIAAEPASLEFRESGDLVGVDEIDSLRLSSMNVDAEEWGISLIHVEALASGADVPQTVELVLFGNVEIESPAADDSAFAAMQAFTFRSGVDDRPCDAAPDSGLLIQTPVGVGEITLLVNEVTIELGSTAFLQANPSDEMVVNVIEGQANLTAQGTSITVPAGALGTIPLDADGLADGPPVGPTSYDESALQSLPIPLLTEQVAIAPALSDEGGTPSGVSNTGESAASGELESGYWMVALVCEGDFPFEVETPAQVTFAEDFSTLSLNVSLLTSFTGQDTIEMTRGASQSYEFYEEAEYDLLGDGEVDGIESTTITAEFAQNGDVEFHYVYTTTDESYYTGCSASGGYVGTEIPVPAGSGLAPIPGIWQTIDSCDEESGPSESTVTFIDDDTMSLFMNESEILFDATDTGLYRATVADGQDVTTMGIYMDFPVVEDDLMEGVLSVFGTECVYSFTP